MSVLVAFVLAVVGVFAPPSVPRLCTSAEIAASDAAHRAGLPDPVVGCDDAESLYVPCESEDGSTAGQVFPCLWDAAVRGNGLGESFVLLVPGGEPLYL